MNEATMEEMNMAMNNSRYAMDHLLHVEFHVQPGLDKAKTEEAGHPIYKDVIWCRVTPPGGQTVDQPLNDITRKRFADRLAKWEAMNRDGEGVVGYRIEEWPAITRAQAETLKYMKVHTVEQLAETPDGNLQGVMGGMGLKQKAQQFLEEAHGADARIAALEAKIAELTADKPKRGRPAKTEE